MMPTGMLRLSDYVRQLPLLASFPADAAPWRITQGVASALEDLIAALGGEFAVRGDVAVHRTARVEEGAIVKGPALVGKGCFIASHAYLRGGVWLGDSVSIGPGCEVKTSVVGQGTRLAHFNYVGDSVLGADVNLEAGAVVANHHNDRADKRILVVIDGRLVDAGVEKFGALLGDGCRIGANAVLSPGTLLLPGSVVGRLELVDQTAAVRAE